MTLSMTSEYKILGLPDLAWPYLVTVQSLSPLSPFALQIFWLLLRRYVPLRICKESVHELYYEARSSALLSNDTRNETMNNVSAHQTTTVPTTLGIYHGLNCFGYVIYAPQTIPYQNNAKLLTYHCNKTFFSFDKISLFIFFGGKEHAGQADRFESTQNTTSLTVTIWQRTRQYHRLKFRPITTSSSFLVYPFLSSCTLCLSSSRHHLTFPTGNINALKWLPIERILWRKLLRRALGLSPAKHQLWIWISEHSSPTIHTQNFVGSKLHQVVRLHFENFGKCGINLWLSVVYIY